MKYAGMPMGMWVLFAPSFRRNLTRFFGLDEAAAKTATREAKEKYRKIIGELPEFEKAAGLPNFMNIPGENSINILSSNEYLTRVNLMDAASEDSDTPVPFGKNVAVIGGGNTAMDSVRTARRLGAERAMIIYRRSEEEMPARIEEVKHAKEEGVEFLTLHNPIEYIADEQGKVKQVILQKMELGEPDASGRRSPVPIPGATETIDIDLAIVSVGVSPNPIVPSSIKGLELGRKGTIAYCHSRQLFPYVPVPSL